MNKSEKNSNISGESREIIYRNMEDCIRVYCRENCMDYRDAGNYACAAMEVSRYFQPLHDLAELPVSVIQYVSLPYSNSYEELYCMNTHSQYNSEQSEYGIKDWISRARDRLSREKRNVKETIIEKSYDTGMKVLGNQLSNIDRDFRSEMLKAKQEVRVKWKDKKKNQDEWKNRWKDQFNAELRNREKEIDIEAAKKGGRILKQAATVLSVAGDSKKADILRGISMSPAWTNMKVPLMMTIKKDFPEYEHYFDLE